MKRQMTRPRGADPLSTTGTPAGRASRWPIRAGIVAMAGIALAAPMVAAEPAAAPAKPAEMAVTAEQSSVEAAKPAEAIKATANSVDGAGQPVSMQLAPEPTTTTAVPAPPPVPAPAPAPAPMPARAAVSSGSSWDRLAQCESGGNWAINTGNGYYGGLQFSAQSWHAVGGSGLPNQASRETQIAMGERLRAAQGWSAWPSCSAKLGLR